MKWLVLGSLILANVIKQPTPAVRVSNGLVRGTVSDDGSYYKYMGIPYASVGVANRFQSPLPPPTWDGVFDAIQENIRCPQKILNANLIVGEEDCLKLNIYTPILRAEKPYPVMVYIHGGCFLEGSGTSLLYGPDYLVNHDVVVITINYRLNVEGFLCLGIKEAPGNAGLKDQIAALKWIKQNIAVFGGDPENVTLFGESAGAVSISHLILSPSARGLFHKTILQSGSSIVPWGIQHDPIKVARDLSQEFGYYGNDPHEIYKVLSNKTVSELILGIKYYEHKNFVTSETLFVPCVEKEIPGVESIITKYPLDIINNGNYTKLPMIRGYNDKEGIYFVNLDFGNSVERVNPYELLQSDLEFPSERSKNTTVEGLVKHYFTKKEDERNGTKDIIMDVVDLYSDLHIKFPVILESEIYAKTNEKATYFYVFAYSGFVNLAKFISKFIFSNGASHADELFYIFKPHITYFPLQIFEKDVTELMVTYWANFAKYSDPTPIGSNQQVRWPPSRAINPRALIIDKHITLAPMWEESRIQFWNNTYAKYRRRNYGFGPYNKNRIMTGVNILTN